METRMHKWKYKRLDMQTEKERLMNQIMNASEKLMVVHSEILGSACKESFDRMLGDPIAQLEEIFKIGG